jgi:hypothetical protein
MATSGENYTRAAHSVPQPQSRLLRAVCFGCRKDIADREGVIHIRLSAVNQAEQAMVGWQAKRAAKATAEGYGEEKLVPFSVEDLLAQPDTVEWQVHCDNCNPHQDDECGDCYWFGVERCRKWADLIVWTAHLAGKSWVMAVTNWMEFIEATADGTATVGLVCDPAERSRNA